MVDCNLKIICNAPLHGVTINQVSAWSNVNCSRNKPETKNLQKLSKGHNCQYLVDCNLEIICVAPHHVLTINQV